MYNWLKPFLFNMEAERAHRLGTGAARLAQATGAPLVETRFAFEHDMLRQTLWGLAFPNPIGLAAGFDKNARLVRFWPKIGFGFAEVGSVSARPAKGNPRPRAFRLPEDEAIINRMGLNNQGARKIAKRLSRIDRANRRPLGVNLAKTHDPRIGGEAGIQDFVESYRLLAPLADYVALNISCPNTAEGKTFEDPSFFHPLLAALFDERSRLGLNTVPILVKFSPPLSDRIRLDSQIDELVAIALQHGVQGFIATNTASDRDGLTSPADVLERIGPGGLSGAPLEKRSTHMVRYLYRKTGGNVPIIGVGGVSSVDTAYAKIRAGASLVQLYTGLVYEGPGVVRRIKEGLVRKLEDDGFSNIHEAVGVDS